MGEVELSQLLSGAAGATAFVYAFLFLLRRGDSQQRDNIAELRRQRNEQTERAEKAEREADRLEAELARFRTEQRVVRHDLKNEVETLRMERDLALRLLDQHGIPYPK